MDLFRARLYAQLAEVLAGPPDWLAWPGRDWPLFETLSFLQPQWEAASQYLVRLAGLPPEAPGRRDERYAAIFSTGRASLGLYEGAARTGKILGPLTFELSRLYREAGLELHSAELPDHICVELDFLAFLAGQDAGRPLERLFLEAHGGWMKDLGHSLVQSGDELYALIGALLADWISAQSERPRRNLAKAVEKALFPALPEPAACTLCGFCAQACPTRALQIREDHQQTRLVLDGEGCTHCGRCSQICSFGALRMESLAAVPMRERVLRASPLVHCQKCARAIVSQAELDYIISQIGASPWQQLCMDCRTLL